MDRFLQRLADAVGPANFLTDEDVTAGFTIDWTGRFRGHTPAVVRPGSTEEVAAVLRECNEERVAVVPQGGNTGLVGGSVPLAGEIVLSLTRLRRLDPVDAAAHQVTAGAGVRLSMLQQHVAAAGLAFGVDLSARDSATLGGMVATNAGGLRTLRYGPMRAQVTGIEAVLADGSVVTHLRGLTKDNTGYDLPGLLCGSEGTLAVVTAARLRLVPRYAERTVAVLALRSLADAVVAIGRLRSRVDTLDAAEVFFDEGVRLVEDSMSGRFPFTSRWPVYLLVESAANNDPTARLGEAVGELGDLVADVAVAREAQRRADLWKLREAHTEAIAQLGTVHKLDVTVPLDGIAVFADRTRSLVSERAPEARLFLFGHLAEGNLHVNVVGPGVDAELDEAILELVVDSRGSVSAEHGIGTTKRAWLDRNRSASEVRVFRAIKNALDPNGILNPAVLLPADQH